MNKIGRERLQKLEDHLREGKLFHKEFDITLWNDTTSAMCGTSGCAIGELPELFPDKWGWRHDGMPFLKSSRFNTVGINGSKFFNLEPDEFDHLFVSHSQDVNSFGGEMLRRNATPLDVANNIHEFLEITK